VLLDNDAGRRTPTTVGNTMTPSMILFQQPSIGGLLFITAWIVIAILILRFDHNTVAAIAVLSASPALLRRPTR
jgi:hypothetical protein